MNHAGGTGYGTDSRLRPAVQHEGESGGLGGKGEVGRLRSYIEMSRLMQAATVDRA